MIDFAKLAAQGRAYSGARAWEPEELEAVLLLERERGVARPRAADFVRNGIMTLEAYDAAEKEGFKPVTPNEAAAKAEAALKDNEFASAAPEKEADEDETVPLAKMQRPQLVARANELGIEFDEDTKVGDLRKLIAEAQAAAPEKEADEEGNDE